MNANRVEWSLLVDTMWRYQGRESSFGSAGWESWKATASHRFFVASGHTSLMRMSNKTLLDSNLLYLYRCIVFSQSWWFRVLMTKACCIWFMKCQHSAYHCRCPEIFPAKWMGCLKMSQMSFHLFLFPFHPASHVHWLILESSSLQAAGIEESLTEIQAFSEGS